MQLVKARKLTYPDVSAYLLLQEFKEAEGADAQGSGTTQRNVDVYGVYLDTTGAEHWKFESDLSYSTNVAAGCF